MKRPAPNRACHTPPVASLIGREAAEASLSQAMAGAAAGRGTTVAVSGPFASGRSAVLGLAAELARAEGLRVLSASTGPFDRGAALGVARRLLRPLVDAQADLLTGGGAAWVAPLFQPAEGEVDPGAVVAGIGFLLDRATEAGPLALLVDDVEAADPGSTRLLAEIAALTETVPVVLVVAVERGAADPAFQAAFAAGPNLSLEPLGPDQVADLARSRLGALSPQLIEELTNSSLGRPGLLVPLLDALAGLLRDGPTLAEELSATDIESVRPPALPGQIEVRLSGAPVEARDLAAAVSVLGTAVPSEVLVAAARIPAGQLAEALTTLARLGLFAPGPGIRWMSPVLGRAMRATLGGGEPGAIALRAARAMHEAGDPPETTAALLATAPVVGEPWAAATLGAAAEEAARRGAAQTAHFLRLRQLEEPMAFEDRGWATAGLANTELRLGDLNGAQRLLDLAPLVEDPFLQARIRYAVGRANLWGADLAGSVASFGIAASGFERSGDDHWARRSHAGRWLAATIGLDQPEAIRARAEVPEPDHSPASCSLWAAAALDGAVWGRGAPEVLAAARAALAADHLITPFASDNTAATAAAHALVAVGRPDEAVEAVDRLIANARRDGFPSSADTVEAARSMALLAAGRLAEAAEAAETTLNSPNAYPIELPTAAATLAMVRLRNGDLVGAEAALVAVPTPDRARLRLTDVHALVANGCVALACGDAITAMAWAERAAATGVDRARFGIDALAFDALMAAGRQEDAAAVAQRWVDSVGEAEPSAAGTARLAWADCHNDVSAAEAGLVDLRAGHQPLALLDGLLGAARLQARLGMDASGPAGPAREKYREALDLAVRLGAEVAAEEALAGARLAGGRPRRPTLFGPDSLTPAELRTARLVAAGHSNRVVADTLYVTRKTVEYHLSNAYRKLGIDRRDELVAALGPAAPPETAGPT